MKYDDNRKNKYCSCGNEISLFSRKCNNCLQKTMKDRKRKEIRSFRLSFCSKCLKLLSGETQEFEGGIMHKSCWLKSL